MKFERVKTLLLFIISQATARIIQTDNVEFRNTAFDPAIYDDALDPELCKEQLGVIQNNMLLRLQFIESGIRLPRGILQLNTLDLGNYDQCLGINVPIDIHTIEGKYCQIQAPLNPASYDHIADVLKLQDYPDIFTEEHLKNYENFKNLKSKLNLDVKALGGKSLDPSRDDGISLPSVSLTLAVCVPKTCTIQEGLRGLYLNNLNVSLLNYEQQFCRFKDDKPWVPADYVSLTIFSVIGLLLILSTCYDLHHLFILKKDPKEASTILRSFSVYSNSKSLTTFRQNSNNLSCIDGIRAISMFWIVVAHTYLTLPPTINNQHVLNWVMDLKSKWIFMAQFGVDTFFFLSGLLVVYTLAGKLSGLKLLKNLHLFYLNRLLRMFPLLAAVILCQISIFHRVADGPQWNAVAANTDSCRTNWWLTLLYVQNYFNQSEMCINHSWFLAIDMHCYIVCPLVLYWVLTNKKRLAWAALIGGVVLTTAASRIYFHFYEFSGSIGLPMQEGMESQNQHYFSTITRAPVFFVGMVFGYILYLYKGKEVKINKFLALALWLCSLGIFTLFTLLFDWMMNFENPMPIKLAEVFVYYSSSIWGLAIGWIIFACQHGYAGPINWFLSLDVWKLPSRISYGMYLFHYQIQFVISGTALTSIFFSDGVALYGFLSQAVISFGVAFAATVIFESPINTLVKLLLGDGPKKPTKAVAANE